MKNVEVSRQLQSLKALIQKATASTQDIELRSHWAKYFCILAAGLLENCLKEIYSEYVSRVSGPSVANYARSQLLRIQNPKANIILDTARSFDPAWERDLRLFMDQDGRKDAIDSIMANRHQIAHGKASGVTITQISDYLTRAEAVLEFIERQVRK